MKQFTFMEKTSLSTAKNHNIDKYLELAEFCFSRNVQPKNPFFERLNYGN